MRKVWFYSICIRCWLNTARKGHKVILCVHLGFLQPPYAISSLVAKIIYPDCSSGNEKSKGSTKGSNQMSVPPKTLGEHTFLTSSCRLWLWAPLDMEPHHLDLCLCGHGHIDMRDKWPLKFVLCPPCTHTTAQHAECTRTIPQALERRLSGEMH